MFLQHIEKVIYVNGKMAGHHVSALVLDVDLIGQYLS